MHPHERANATRPEWQWCTFTSASARLVGVTVVPCRDHSARVPHTVGFVGKDGDRPRPGQGHGRGDADR